MSIIELGCRLAYYVDFETSFIFQITVLESRNQLIRKESLSFQPDPGVKVATSGDGRHRIHRLLAQPGWLNIYYNATVSSNPSYTPAESLLQRPHSELPAEVLPYLNPSRYCESDRMESFAWKTFGHLTADHERVQAVTDWVYQHLSYEPGSTGSSTTACDVFLQRCGVCRDFAHLTIALCRALGIPTRYVAGYATDLMPPDFHGFVEVFLDNGWYLFDATRLAPVDGFVRIGIGRDAADLSFATFVGNSTLNEIYVWSNTIGEHPAVSAHDGQAVSLG